MAERRRLALEMRRGGWVRGLGCGHGGMGAVPPGWAGYQQEQGPGERATAGPRQEQPPLPTCPHAEMCGGGVGKGVLSCP